MFKQIIPSQVAGRKLCTLFLMMGLIACLFVGESLAGGKGNKGGGEDIILYNGNIVLRGGGGGKGKGKGGMGSIVVANSPSHSHDHHEYMPMYDSWGGHGFRRRR